MPFQLPRRKFLAAGAGLLAAQSIGTRLAWGGKSVPSPGARLSRFTQDVTVPLGHPLMGGGIAPSKSVADPLSANGVVLEGAGPTVVLIAVDWCEIRNAAYDRWRAALAEAAQTKPEYVLLASVHQHDAPVADLRAEEILKARKLEGSVCNLEFHEQAVRSVAAAVVAARKKSQPVTHIGTGQAKVDRVASNRRYLTSDGQVRYDRMSTTRDPLAREAAEGTIDPLVKTISFWNGDQPLAALNCYATHPMSSYGQGLVSSDFVGLARQRRQGDQPGVQQIYFSGCSGNVTAGKYNDGAPLNRVELADRLYRGMAEAWKSTVRKPLNQWEVRIAPLTLEPRSSEGFSKSDLEAQLVAGQKPFDQCLAAMGLSWRERLEAGQQLQVPAVDFGSSQFLLLPGETYIEYQLYAQQVRPDSFVAVAGYGECATGYVPIERAWQEQDGNLRDWCWVAPGAETPLKAAIREALRVAAESATNAAN